MIDSWLGEDWENAVDDSSDKFYAYLLAQAEHQDLRQDGSYDAGFEAGVLASEAGLGRYSD